MLNKLSGIFLIMIGCAYLLNCFVDVYFLMQINQILQIFNSAIHISEPLLERMSLFSVSTASTVTGVASCQYQNIHNLRHNGHNSALLLKCVYVGACV